MALTLGSLFDGLGGWQIAAVRAGIIPIWSSEIEKFPLALTKIRFPDTKQLGDITKIDGKKIDPVDIITMGSPCQDLSIAGKRAGLAGERSGLFVRAINIIQDMREATNGKRPRYVVWENVTGAYSSNKGMDFKAVLEAFTETSIPVPRHNKWSGAGMVRSRICTVIWRTLDAQYWGVPQRRRRIFLVADYTGGGGTEEILFKPESLHRNTEQGNEEGKEITGHTKTGTRSTGSDGMTLYDMSHPCDVIRSCENISPTLQTRMGTGGNGVPLTMRIRTGKPGSGKGALISDKGQCLGTANDQVLFDTYSRLTYESVDNDDKGACLRSSGGINGGAVRTLCYTTKVGTLQATDYKGVRNQMISENKLIVEEKQNDGTK